MIKSWLLFILQTDFFTLRYNNNTHSNPLCTNWHIEKRLVYQGRKEKLYNSGQLWNITKLPIIKWKKKITDFCRLLTCLYLLKRLNPQQELIPKQGSLLPWGTKRSEIGNTLSFLCMFIQNTRGAFWNGTCGKVGKRCVHALELVNLTLLKKWSLLLNWSSICEIIQDHQVGT